MGRGLCLTSAETRPRLGEDGEVSPKRNHESEFQAAGMEMQSQSRHQVGALPCPF